LNQIEHDATWLIILQTATFRQQIAIFSAMGDYLPSLTQSSRKTQTPYIQNDDMQNSCLRPKPTYVAND